jgi:hypothetical protein
MDQDSIMLAGAWPGMQCCKLMLRHFKLETNTQSMLAPPTVQWSNGIVIVFGSPAVVLSNMSATLIQLPTKTLGNLNNRSLANF